MYYDLTELNYVARWASNLPPADAQEHVCVLNGQTEPCTKFLRGGQASRPRNMSGASTEFYLPALPFGENRLEIRRADGYPLTATHFVVCRRVMEVDFNVGADGKVETADDQAERVRTLAWKDGLADWEAVNVWADPASNETRIHSYAHRVTDTVEVYDSQQQLLTREVRRFSVHGPPITSDTYSPNGELLAYEDPCLVESSPFGFTNSYPDGSCESFAPSAAVIYGNSGSDSTWHTGDDHVLRMTEYYNFLGDGWGRGPASHGQWLRTRFLVPPTQSTLQGISGWLPKAKKTEELHEPDPARPGLWLRTLRSEKEADVDKGLVGYRKYEYQCAP